MHGHRRQTDQAGEPRASALGQPQGHDRQTAIARPPASRGALLEGNPSVRTSTIAARMPTAFA